MNPEFWNISQGSSHGFSGRIPVGIDPSSIGKKKKLAEKNRILWAWRVGGAKFSIERIII